MIKIMKIGVTLLGLIAALIAVAAAFSGMFIFSLCMCVVSFLIMYNISIRVWDDTDENTEGENMIGQASVQIPCEKSKQQCQVESDEDISGVQVVTLNKSTDPVVVAIVKNAIEVASPAPKARKPRKPKAAKTSLAADAPKKPSKKKAPAKK
jgi:membrane glycosyltransferase